METPRYPIDRPESILNGLRSLFLGPRRVSRKAGVRGENPLGPIIFL